MELEIVAHFTYENASETHEQNVKFYKCYISKQHLIVKKYTQTVKTVALLSNYVLFIVVKFFYVKLCALFLKQQLENTTLLLLP